ncbi:unnamed protein product [Cylindrotheca closterium]|uniref:Riboflavin kinase n=1 Tax=Cylindrotheca closterium TaxID=2856 RepID=A0AAD2CFM7_9STRA|nr:unnamed protein product [Cylindrotheca closterium]
MTNEGERSPIPSIKGILFDLDGTLLDTESLSDQALLMAFGDSLPNTIDKIPWELKQQLLGLRGAEWVPIALKYGAEKWGVENAPSPAEIWKNWEDRLNSLCHQVEKCKGAQALVCALAAKNMPMAIATSSRYAGVNKKRMRHEDIFQHIQLIVAGDDPAVKNGKPAPDIYLEAARQLKVDPKECLVFEDALSGVRAGKAAGCFVVAIPDSRFTEKEKTVFREEADLVLDDLTKFDGSKFGISLDLTKT